ncbi:unnamed protein product [Brassica napus]|uniref:(rape) hypothetical protein n=1 Tax=Brassica napus TaxID=3708 RepID=A0A816M9U8_BRANA|nr:unnamed protein product [Brassica napus]
MWMEIPFKPARLILQRTYSLTHQDSLKYSTSESTSC